MPYKLNPVTGKLDYYEASSGSANLSTVLGNGNTSGPNDIQFDATQGVLFNNSSRLREGTIDALLGGSKGIAQICAVGYELKWEAGRQYVMDGNGIYIRWSLYNFTITPTVNDDVTLGYLTGSRWSLDDGTTYVCTDNTTGAAVWEIQEYDFIGFDTATAHSVGVGELAWNNTDGTLDLGLQGGLKNKVGQQLVVKARNTSGSLISKGSVVRVVGVAGGFIGINLAQADNDTNSATAFGIVAEDIADSSNGFVTINGIVHGVNTNAYTEGDILYLSPTVAGEITNVKPVSPNHMVVVGYVAKKSLTDGHILLHVQNGYELDELHDVTITSAANNDALVYETSTALWKNKTIGGWNYIVLSANQDVINTIVPQDITEFQFSVVANGHYMVEVDICWSGNDPTGDYQSNFLVTAGVMKAWGISLVSDQATPRIITCNSSASAQLGQFQLASTDIDFLMSAKVNFNFSCTQNATFKFQVRNAAAAAGRISRTWKGSILKYKKIN